MRTTNFFSRFTLQVLLDGLADRNLLIGNVIHQARQVAEGHIAVAVIGDERARHSRHTDRSRHGCALWLGGLRELVGVYRQVTTQQKAPAAFKHVIAPLTSSKQVEGESRERLRFSRLAQLLHYLA